MRDIRLILDKEYQNFKYDEGRGCYINCTRERAEGLSKIIAFGNKKRKFSFPCRVAFNAEKETAILFTGSNGGGSIADGITHEIVLGSYYSRQKELLEPKKSIERNDGDKDFLKLKDFNGRIVEEYVFLD